MTSSNERNDDVLSSVLIETADGGPISLAEMVANRDENIPDLKATQPRPAVTSTYVTNTGDTVAVTGYRGTQDYGFITGDPVNLTRFGGVDVQVTSEDGTVIRLSFSDSDDLSNLLDTLNHARRVADSRDYTNDVTRSNR